MSYRMQPLHDPKVLFGTNFHGAGLSDSPSSCTRTQEWYKRMLRQEDRISKRFERSSQGNFEDLPCSLEVQRLSLKLAVLLRWVQPGDHNDRPRRATECSS